MMRGNYIVSHATASDVINVDINLHAQRERNTAERRFGVGELCSHVETVCSDCSATTVKHDIRSISTARFDASSLSDTNKLKTNK
jgi:hypothetical protein